MDISYVGFMANNNNNNYYNKIMIILIVNFFYSNATLYALPKEQIKITCYVLT